MKKLLLIIFVAVLMLNLAKATDISNCTNLTSAGEVYNLTSILYGDQSGQPFCIAIQADNVTLDCGWSNYLRGNHSGDTGIYIYNVNNATVKNCTVADYTYGINLTDTYSSTLYYTGYDDNNWSIVLDSANNTNVSSAAMWQHCDIGIEVNDAHNNNINGNIYGCDIWDFRSEGGSTNNTITSLSMHSANTRFTYSGDVNLRGLRDESIPYAGGYAIIDDYVNITNSSAGAWVFLNISAGGYCINESSIFMANFNQTPGGTWDTNTSNFSSSHGVNIFQNYVYANITSFGKIYGPLGEWNGSGNCPTNTLLVPELSDYSIFGILILIGIALFASKKYI
jgi:parallel beta-helix repeat protein